MVYLFRVLWWRWSWAVEAGSAGDDYYVPYGRYGRPVHLKEEEACGLPSSLEVYFFAFVRDEASPEVLGQFLRWYAATGIDFRLSSKVVLHSTSGGATQRSMAVLADYGATPELVFEYSSRLKARKVNLYLDTLPSTAWLVYPDVDEFFLFPCDWGGPPLSSSFSSRRGGGGAIAATSLSTTTRTLSNRPPPGSLANVTSFDFVGGEMFDRVSRDWRLARVKARSLFKEFPVEVRATGCLFQSRPFKQLLTRTACLGAGRQRFESSHLTRCFVPVDHATAARRKTKQPLPPGVSADLIKRKKPPTISPTTFAFPHFRFTADALGANDAKSKAYAKLTTTTERKNPHVDHAARVYRQTALYFRDDAFRPEVRLVLELECLGDRPNGATYDRTTAGRLDDKRKRTLLRLLVLEEGAPRTRKAFADLFATHYYPPANRTRVIPDDTLRRLEQIIASGQSHQKSHQRSHQRSHQSFSFRGDSTTTPSQGAPPRRGSSPRRRRRRSPS
mmetsp:Transcript_14536/g.47363  ORF Transcript_14536/g.47363 Transcript_14536/m.47363 type:complete len:503 (-) Transcript_14536:174-1682(-)